MADQIVVIDKQEANLPESIEYRLRRQNWSAANSLPDPTLLSNNPELIRTFFATVEPDMWAEYDARFLFDRLDFKLTTLEQTALAYWKIDEENHADGLKALLLSFPNSDITQLEDRLYGRKAEFKEVKPLLEDKFLFWVTFAYDELVTVAQYGGDRKLYNEVGGEGLQQWVKKIQIDEMNHYENALTILQDSFRDRFNEVAAIVDTLVINDINKPKYNNIFIGHRGEVVLPEEFYPRMGNVMKRRLLASN